MRTTDTNTQKKNGGPLPGLLPEHARQGRERARAPGHLAQQPLPAGLVLHSEVPEVVVQLGEPLLAEGLQQLGAGQGGVQFVERGLHVHLLGHIVERNGFLSSCANRPKISN